MTAETDTLTFKHRNQPASVEQLTLTVKPSKEREHSAEWHSTPPAHDPTPGSQKAPADGCYCSDL